MGVETNTRANWSDFLVLLQRIANNYYYVNEAPQTPDRTMFMDTVEQLRVDLQALDPDREPRQTSFWLQILQSTASQTERMWSMDWSDYSSNPSRLLRLRDEQMGRNLIWLADVAYPKRRLIVWAASFHIVRNIETIEVIGDPGFYDGLTTMGQVVWDELGNDVYTLGFTAYEGTAGPYWVEPWDIGVPEESSLEYLMHQAGLENAVVDFRTPARGGGWLAEERVSWPLGYTPMRTNWTQVMDGIFFTHSMVPSQSALGVSTNRVPQPTDEGRCCTRIF